MPDGNIFHGLSGLYQKPYQRLCEAKFELNVCVWITMEAFLVESQIATGLLNKHSDRKASSKYVVSSQQG
ncbi:MAG: hypothetical protein SAK29_20870 [Scytonema sp. PMC 1069.18]|nr:hypothetical protein [Scytonema sp. PMC 1069.18]MEC4886599.1 hypothetical protein [Scytonema sp. PMC 1070.18]